MKSNRSFYFVSVISCQFIWTEGCTTHNSDKSRADEDWCYEDPKCEPSTWPGLCATGKMQSPINFDDTHTKIKILPPIYHQFYEEPPPETKNFVIENTGKTVEIFFPEGEEPILKGVPIALPGNYRFVQMHFHWGNSSMDGSEHRIGGKGNALELHLVHYSTIYQSYAEASVAPKDPFAVAIMSILFDTNKDDNPALKSIIDSIPLIRKYEDEHLVKVSKFLDLKPLFPAHLDFYRYEGSLTTPDCHENRVWTVFRNPNKISKRQLRMFRTVFQENNEDLVLTNHRPVQRRNGRPITLYLVPTNPIDWVIQAIPRPPV